MEHRLPVLMGRRVLLREPTQADGEHLFAYTTDPVITQFLAFESPRTVEDTLQFIQRCEEYRKQDREYVFVIADRSSDVPRGVTALRHLDPPARTAQIGTWLRREDWGARVNAEAKALLLDYAFNVLDLHRIEARIAITNHRSRRAFERLGGRREGTLKESFYKDGVFQDQGLYAILSSEWQSRGGGAALLQSLPAGADG
jgi:[ribosomal protein S5]-alanine N-acetyltransferase